VPKALRFSIYGMGYSLPGVLHLLMIPYLSQRLGVEEFARLAIAVASINWMAIFAFLGTHGALKVLGIKERSSAREVLWACISVACASGGAVSVLGLAGLFLGFYKWDIAY